MEDSDAPWDVLHDLNFLFATEHSSEDNIEDILDLVDAPVEGKSDEVQCVTNRSQRSKKRRVRIDYQRAKLDALRSEVANLKTKLRAIKELKTQCSTTAENGIEMSTWEVAARRERTERIRCQHENEELRAAVDDRAAFIENIKRQVFKKPRLQTLPVGLSDEDLQLCRLPKQLSLRISAIHAIADREYRRQNTAFILAGVHDKLNDYSGVAPFTLPNSDRVYLQVQHVMNIDAPYRRVAAACWRIFQGPSNVMHPESATETIDIIDDYTMYERYSQKHKSIMAHVNTVRKYYPGGDQDVIVRRTILDDALVQPPMSEGAVDDTWGWLVVVPHANDRSKCRFIGLLQSAVSPFQRSNTEGRNPLDDAIAALKSISFTQTMDAPMDIIQDPALYASVSRAKLFEKAFKSTLRDVVARKITADSLKLN
ncbi:unnamed protein product [Aphanomyces euteiches]|uniref:START domain-containing protein n=1 Tax=Aphanomyces euteiches TaxID=100861 RepID=A0A6G0X840_9STRA|nr:hypothetical protein Ae201684_007657 [Aphanomyces euteiches]